MDSNCIVFLFRNYEPVTTVQSNSTFVSSVSKPDSNSADLGRYEGAYEDQAISMASLSNAVQSSRDILYGDSIDEVDF